MKPPAADKYIRRELDPAAREFYARLERDGAPSSTRCERCERTSFPPRLHCPSCGGEQSWVELPREGTLYAFTTQERALRFTAPIVLAVAELGEGVEHGARPPVPPAVAELGESVRQGARPLVSPVTVPGVMEADYEELEIGAPVRAFAREEPETGLHVVGFEPIS